MMFRADPLGNQEHVALLDSSTSGVGQIMHVSVGIIVLMSRKRVHLMVNMLIEEETI